MLWKVVTEEGRDWDFPMYFTPPEKFLKPLWGSLPFELLFERQHMETAQQEQRRYYNHTAWSEEFRPIDRVLLLLPSSSCKFLTHWQGSYTVEVKVGPVNNCQQQPGKRAQTKEYHINLIKLWIEPLLALTATVSPVKTSLIFSFPQWKYRNYER